MLGQIFPHAVSLRILDVGVGDTAGTTFRMLELAEEAKGFSIEIVGIDRDENIVSEANEQALQRGLDSKIHFLTTQNFRIPIKGNVVCCFNVLRYYYENDFQEMVNRLGNAVEENGILVIGNNDVNEFNSLIAFVFQKNQGKMQKKQVIFGRQERLNERFVATLKGFPQNDRSIRDFRADVPAARMEVQRGEVFSFEQALGSRGYIIKGQYGLVIMTLAELSKQSVLPALVRKTEAIVSEDNRERLVQRAI